MNSNLLRGAIAKNGTTQTELAKEMNIAMSSFTRKMKRGSFTLSEAKWLIDKLNIGKMESVNIFFA